MQATDIRVSLRRTALGLAMLTTTVGALAMLASTFHYGSHLPNMVLAWLGASIVTAGLVAVSLANDNEGTAAAHRFSD
jgi:hypothetical protein